MLLQELELLQREQQRELERQQAHRMLVSQARAARPQWALLKRLRLWRKAADPRTPVYPASAPH